MQAHTFSFSVKHGSLWLQDLTELAVSVIAAWTLYTDLYARAPLDVLHWCPPDGKLHGMGSLEQAKGSGRAMCRLTLCKRENEAKRVMCKACKAPRWDWQLHGRVAAILQHRDLNSFTLPQVIVAVASLSRCMMRCVCTSMIGTTPAI